MLSRTQIPSERERVEGIAMAGRACLQALRRALVMRTSSVPLQPLASHIVRRGYDLANATGRCWNSPSHEHLFVSSAQRRMSCGHIRDGPSLGAGRRERDDEAEEDDEADEREAIEPAETEEAEVIQERPPSALDMMLKGVPRRRQRFIIQKALKVKPEGEIEERASRRGFDMKVIDVNRTVKVTKGGKVQSFTALVVTGNYDGVVGFGKGKSAEIGPAIDKASRKALSNLHFFERYQGHTIFHEHNSKYERTKIYLWPARSGTGMKASHTVGGILRLAGYKNVKSKVIGSRHPLNTVKAVFQALSEIESPAEVAERRGRMVVESHLLVNA